MYGAVGQLQSQPCRRGAGVGRSLELVTADIRLWSNGNTVFRVPLQLDNTAMRWHFKVSVGKVGNFFNVRR